MIRRAVWLRRAFTSVSLAWAAALPLAAYVASGPSPAALPYLFALTVYLIGSAVCHQIDARSFHLFGHQLPVCARCTGVYFGAAAAVVAGPLAAARRTLAGRAAGTAHAPGFAGWSGRRALLMAAAAPAAATLVFEWTTGVTPSNGTRAATGVLLGAAIAATVVTAGNGRREANNVVN